MKRVGPITCLLLFCVGCVGKPELPGDPLFTNGKPTESKAQIGPPAPPAFSEPMPPANKATH